MKIKASAMAATVLLGLALPVAGLAQQIVGYNAVNVPAGADVLVAIPFTGSAEDTFTVTGVLGGGITVDGPLADDTYDSDYYVRVVEDAVDDSSEGLWSTITNTDANQLDVADPAILAYMNVGDVVRVYKHLTVIEIFPAGANGFMFDSNTELLIYEGAPAGQNKPTTTILNYAVVPQLGFNGWNNGLPFNDSNGLKLSPGSHLRIRNNNAAGTRGEGDLTYVSRGVVPDHDMSMILDGSTEDDVIVSTGLPVPVKMIDSGLRPICDQDAGGTSTILVYDNGEVEKNKPAANVLRYRELTVGTTVYYNGWHNGAPFSDFNDYELGPSEGFVIRRTVADAPAKVTIPSPY